MRCVGCDQELSDYEATIKYECNEYVDLCNECMKLIDIATISRVDLLTVGDEWYVKFER